MSAVSDWEAFLKRMRQLDERDISDEAMAYAKDTITHGGMPPGTPELEAELECAFEAGRRWGLLEALRLSRQ